MRQAYIKHRPTTPKAIENIERVTNQDLDFVFIPTLLESPFLKQKKMV